MTKYGKILALALLAVMLLAVPGFAVDAAYPGVVKYTIGALIGPDGKWVLPAEGYPGHIAPLRGTTVVSGVDTGGLVRILKLTTGGYALFQADFSGTDGTTAPTKSALMGAKDASGYIQDLYSDSSGRLYTIIYSANFAGTTGTNVPSAGSLSSGKDPSGYLVPLNVDANGKVVLGASALTIGNITATDFTGTAGTTTGLGAKGVTINGLASGVPYSLAVDANGHLQLDVLTLTGADFTGTSGTTDGLGTKTAMIGGQASGVPYVLQVDSSGRIVLGPSSQTIGNITATDFTGTQGTTTGLGTKSVIVAGLLSGVPYSLAVNASGQPQVGIVTLSGENFSGTSGTTDNWGSKIIPVGGLNSGVPTALAIDSSGRLSATLRATDPAGSNVSVKADPAGFLINAPTFPYSDGTSATANVATTDSQTIIASSGTAYHTITGINCSAGAAAGEVVVSIGGTAKWRKYAAANSSADSPPGLCYAGTLAQAVTITGPASYTYNLHYKTITP